MWDAVLAVTDPVNALLLAGLWLRIERHAERVNRVETKLIGNGLND